MADIRWADGQPIIEQAEGTSPTVFWADGQPLLVFEYRKEVICYVDPDAMGTGTGVDWTNAYTSLNAWEAAEQVNLLTNNEWMHVYCRSSSGTADTYVSINSWTTGEFNNIIIEAVSGDEAVITGHDTNRYRLERTDGTCISVYEPYIKFKGLQIKATYSASSCIGININSCPVGTIDVDSCRIEGSGGASGTIRGITLDDADITLKVYNSIVSNMGVASTQNVGITILNGIAVIYNTIIYGTNRGAYFAGGTTNTVKNVAAFNNTNDFLDSASSTIDYCASDDNDGTNNVAQSSGDANWTDDFVDAANGNFTLLPNCNLIGAGLANPSSGVYLDDIAGKTRAGTSWDVGAFEINEIVAYVDPDATGSANGRDWTNAYTSLNAWEAAFERNLVVCGATSKAFVRSSSGTVDNVATVINGWITGAAYYILIEAASTDRADADGWDSAKYIHNNTIQIYIAYIRIKNIQCGGLNYNFAVRARSTVASQDIRIEGCRFKCQAANRIDDAILVTTANSNVSIFNNIIESGTETRNGIDITAGTVKIYNNTIYGCTQEGIKIGAGCTVTIKNNAIFNTADDILDGGSATIDYNATDDNDGTHNVVQSSGDTHWTDDFVDAANGDFTLKSGSNLIDAGTDDPGDGLYDDDIEGTIRS